MMDWFWGEKGDYGLAVGVDWSLGWLAVCMVVGERELWRQRMMVGSGGSKLEIVGCSRFRQ